MPGSGELESPPYIAYLPLWLIFDVWGAGIFDRREEKERRRRQQNGKNEERGRRDNAAKTCPVCETASSMVPAKILVSARVKALNTLTNAFQCRCHVATYK
jgi:hypothetical protein